MYVYIYTHTPTDSQLYKSVQHFITRYMMSCMYMYMFMCVYIYIYIYVCMYVYIYTYKTSQLYRRPRKVCSTSSQDT